MIACLQRVSRAEVRVEGEVVGAIGCGLLVLLGVAKGDTRTAGDALASRVARYRCFAGNGKPMNRSLLDLDLGALVVSQFTLCADTRKGLRPGFDPAMPPEPAEGLYEAFVRALQREGVDPVETGVFGALMEISLVNDGPVTLLLEQRPRGALGTTA